MLRAVLMLGAFMWSILATQDDPGGDDPPTGDPPTDPPEQTFTQEDVDRIAARRGKDAKQAAINELLGELEVDSLDDLKGAYQAYRKIEEESQDEAEAERKAKEKAEADLAAAREGEKNAWKLADERAIKAELKVQLLGEGARKDRLQKILKDADLSEASVEEEEVKNLEPVVKWAKEEYPEWFGQGKTEIPTTPDGSQGAKKGVAKSYMDRKYGSEQKAI